MKPIIESAFVLGAGLGTRLRPVTAQLPKPLVPVCGKPLITYAFDHLLSVGVKRIVVNTHHAAEAYDIAFPGSQYRGIKLELVHEPILLETGGGIANVAERFDGPFYVYNGDILTDLDLEELARTHFHSNAECTLAVRPEGGPLHVAIDHGWLADVRGWVRDLPGTHLFTGVSIADSRFTRRLVKGEIVSVVKTWLQMLRENTPPAVALLPGGVWRDLGSREEYLNVNCEMAAGKWSLSYASGSQCTCRIAPDAQIAPDALVSEDCVIGRGVTIASGAKVRSSVIWDNATIQPGAVVERCVILEGRTIEGMHHDAAL